MFPLTCEINFYILYDYTIMQRLEYNWATLFLESGPPDSGSLKFEAIKVIPEIRFVTLR